MRIKGIVSARSGGSWNHAAARVCLVIGAFVLAAPGAAAQGVARPFFAPRVDYAAAPGAIHVAIGDLDGDGKPELVVANGRSNTVSVWRNLGNGAFASRVDYAAGAYPSWVAIGDLDGDGRADLVVANLNRNGVTVLRNLGNGAFAAGVDYPTSYVCASVAIGDLNGDGWPDLVVTHPYETALSVLPNLGNGAFAGPRLDAGGLVVAIGDLDGDGRPDVAVAGGGVSVLRNIGAYFAFAAPVYYATGTRALCVAIGDLDGDDRPDLVTANYGDQSSQIGSSVTTLRNVGNGTFTDRTDYATGAGSVAVAVGDLDGDGKPELLVANQNGDTVSILRNRGDGTFAPREDYSTRRGPGSIAIGDLNGDGKLDLVVLSTGGINNETVSIFRNVYCPNIFIWRHQRRRHNQLRRPQPHPHHLRRPPRRPSLHPRRRHQRRRRDQLPRPQHRSDQLRPRLLIAQRTTTKSKAAVGASPPPA